MVVRRVRQAAVAGYFYPEQPDALRDALRRLTASGAFRVPARGVIVPHGSFAYSGAIAGETLSRLVVPRCCVILGPNHTGWGASWSVMAEGAYETPLGEVPIDEAMAASLLKACPLLAADDLAHRGEHAIEALLPFLQWLGPEDLAIVPLVVGGEDGEEIDQVAGVLVDVISQSAEPALLVASCEFTRYEPMPRAAYHDAQAIELIQQMNEQRFLQGVRARQAMLCGAGPVACVLGASRRLGATKARLVRYATSADAGGDPHSAIGYAGIIIT